MTKLNELSNEELALLYVNGDNKAFDLLLSRTKDKLYSYILYVVHDTTVAEDVFQETYLKAITRLKQGAYNTTGKFISWLIRIAHNIIIDSYREVRALNIIDNYENSDFSTIFSADTVETNIETRMVNKQTLNDIKILLAQLPQLQREIVEMRFYQHLSFKEIAEQTGMSINTALGRMRYAVLNMRRMARNVNLDYIE